MVRIIRRYQCSKCRKGFPSFREAENCEIDHAVKGAAAEALADFRAACLADDMDYEEEDCDPEGPAFDCAGYYPEPAGEFYCPLWGSEECDWECPHGGKE